MAVTRITVPDKVQPGQILEVQWLIAHPMETGHRSNDQGQVVPRDIISRFECRYLGQTVISLELFPAIAANPYFAFTMVAERSGDLEFVWTGDHGFEQRELRRLEVQT
ncbi:thiosulfate oxidation carrier complex protein SoxZ [Roseateles sp. SL47]|uniref:thiosulfate oxidation carrier complex protein SoxZ n=1 Tax=Roseateles sp. SL47 TaxID=2995138 RepID=UPI0022716E25|nr:thiosulfate oxidation carrier complex protein SoxZ [Roseateles sp. SL47]WAC74211.1 thiosulfate oxidation carrier complex protein SoxZ [Roseateles sp. SL47]